jgi:S1-C subfamily serine protease
MKGLPAEAAGLQINDVVLAADGANIGDEQSLTARLDAVPAGGSIRLTIRRRGEKDTREIT